MNLWPMVSRNLAVRRMRTALTLLGIAVGMMAIVALMGNLDLMGNLALLV